MEFIVLLLCIFPVSHTYLITVDAQDTECFYENVTAKSSKIIINFEVAEGGFLDLDVSLTSPNNSVLLYVKRKSNGAYVIPANGLGKFKLCLNNTISTVTSKVVKFDMVIEAPKEQEADPTQLEKMILDLHRMLQTAQKQQEYLLVRTAGHHKINVASNLRVTIWSIFEAALMAVLGVMQVYYLKSFFERRRPV